MDYLKVVGSNSISLMSVELMPTAIFKRKKNLNLSIDNQLILFRLVGFLFLSI